ncbi:PH domain-containing protein [Sphingobacterium cellulitidis]|uniref:PH domain-containing protein n=1 Tax=Sphingobacterium cellulitidis TaxID=1768011 RepID=UPI0015C6772F|nr:PH domain-containing protein [Sphingobacterium cellulitidis]
MENYQIDKFVQDGQDAKVVEKIHGKILDMLTPGESINYIALQKKPAVNLLPDSITVSNRRIFLCEFTKLGLATNFEIFPWKDIKDIAFKEEIFGSKVTVIPFTGENLTIDYIPKTQARKLYQLIKDALANLQNQKAENKENKGVIENKPVFNAPVTKPEEKVEPIQPVAPIEPERPTELPKFEERPSLNSMFAQQNQQQQSKPENQGFQQSNSYTPPTPAVPEPIVSENKVEEEDEITLKLKKLKTLYDKQLITQAEYETKKAEVLSQL